MAKQEDSLHQLDLKWEKINVSPGFVFKDAILQSRLRESQLNNKSRWKYLLELPLCSILNAVYQKKYMPLKNQE